MKKLSALILAAIMCISCLVACGNSQSDELSNAESSNADNSENNKSTPNGETASDATSSDDTSSDDTSSDDTSSDDTSSDDTNTDTENPDEKPNEGDDVIDNKPSNDYWGFDDYEDFENPGAPEELTSFPTTLTKFNDAKYTMQCETEAGLMTVTLEKRPWGMFNLWAWNLRDKQNKLHTFLAGATDLEYVFRTVTPSGRTVFSGGNHGDEAFISIDFYNAETGEKIELSNGQSITVNSLHIIEKSKLLWLPDNNGDSIADYDGVNIKEYTDDDVYAEVTRKYTVVGPQVKLNTDFTYVKDTKHQYSYYAMFPISKKYGLWCDMIDRNGNLIKTIETLKIGKADYSGPQYSGNAATRVVLYGHVDPRYQFDIRINTPTDSLGNSQNEFKTSIWDMNTTDNKVYFSKYPTSGTATVTAGTELHTETIWLFKFVEDAKLPEGSEVSKPFEEIKPEGTLVSSGKEYVISGNGIGYGVYTAKLTDGKWAQGLTYDSQWFGFLATAGNNVVSGIGSVTVDLGEEQNLSSARIHVCNGGESGISAPAEIKVYVSSDGTNFTEAGNLPLNLEVSNAVYWATLNGIDKTARYVRFDIKLNGGFSFINEVEVYAE